MARITIAEESADPTTPPTGVWSLYFKSGGLYYVDDAGAVIGPLSVGLASQIAHSILANASGSSAVPSALALSEQTVLGRVTGGTLVGLVIDDDLSSVSSSHDTIPSAKATKTYVDNAVTGLLDFKGSTDASSNPNYPAASKGDSYVVSVAGKVGGASGKSVDVGDVYLATADNAGGTEASVGTSWIVLEHNLSGALLASNNLSDLTNAGTGRTNLGMSANGSSFVTAADYAAMLTLIFGVDLPENIAFTMDDALSADGKFCAIEAEDGTAGEALAFGNICIFNSSSKWVKADADAAATTKGKAGFCILAAAANNDPTKILRRGKLRADAVFPAMTAGDQMFISLTAGEIVASVASFTTGDVIRAVGYANSADELDVDISPDYFEKA